MLPAIESTVLSTNPRFSQMYNSLTGSLLNTDGSIQVSCQRARASLEKAIGIAQTTSAKAALIRSTLMRLSYGSNELPEELQEVIDIVSSQLTTQLSPSARDILSDDLVHFREHLLPIGEALSSDLSKTASHLRRIAYPGAHQDTHTRTPSLTYFMQTRCKDLASTRETLSESRLKLAMAASSVLELHRGIVEVAIRALEQTKYGSVARGIKAQTEHLAIVAESMDAKLQVMNLEALNEAYTPEVRTALARYRRHLDDARLRLKQREYQAERQLREYESSGNGMKEIAEKYGELRKELDSVIVDVKRLGREN